MRNPTLLQSLLVLISGIVRADVGLRLDPEAQPAAPGAEVLFSGTLTNTSLTERVYLNQVTVQFTNSPPGETALSRNAFFSNVPGILLPGEVYNGPLFRIAVSKSPTAVRYSGTITVQGGGDLTASANLSAANFTVLAGPIDQWRSQNFGDAASEPAAADLADWDGDGLSNLWEYAHRLDPRRIDTIPPQPPMFLDHHLTLSFIPVVPDVIYTVEASTNLLRWETTSVEAVALPPPVPPGQLAFRYRNSVLLPGQAFMRLSITRAKPGR